MQNLENKQNIAPGRQLPQELPLAPAYNQNEIKQISQASPVQANIKQQVQHQNIAPTFDSYQPKLKQKEYNPMNSIPQKSWKNKKPSEMTDAEYELYLKEKTIQDYKKLIESVLTNPKVSTFEKEQSKNNYQDDPIYKKMYDQRKEELEQQKQPQQKQYQQEQEQYREQQQQQEDVEAEQQIQQQNYEEQKPQQYVNQQQQQLPQMQQYGIPDPMYLFNENRMLQQKLFNMESDYQNLQRKYEQLYDDMRRIMIDKDNAEKQVIATQQLLINYKQEMEKMQQSLLSGGSFSRPRSALQNTTQSKRPQSADKNNQTFNQTENQQQGRPYHPSMNSVNQIDQLLNNVNQCIDNYKVGDITMAKYGLQPEETLPNTGKQIQQTDKKDDEKLNSLQSQLPKNEFE